MTESTATNGAVVIPSAAFPSLDEEKLARLGASSIEQHSAIVPAADEATAVVVPKTSVQLSEQELEERYGALSVCLRSDRETTAVRLARSRRKRDQTETNMMAELAKCREAVAAGSNADAQLQMQLLEAAAKAAVFMVQAAEAYGAVQQEARVLNALDLITQYVESLRMVHIKLREEIKEHRNLLTQNNISTQVERDPPPRNRHGSLSASTPPALAASKRRASIAAMPRSSSATVGVGGATSLVPSSGLDEASTPRFRLGLNYAHGHLVNRRKSLQPRTSLTSTSGLSCVSSVAAAAELTAAAAKAALASESPLHLLERGDSYGRIDPVMSDITELSESRRESVASKTDGDVEDAPAVSPSPCPGIRPSQLPSNPAEAGDFVDDLDDTEEEDQDHGAVSELNALVTPVDRPNRGIVAALYVFLITEFLGSGMDVVYKKLSELRRNSYRMVRMSVSCCLLAAAAAILVSTVVGGGGGSGGETLSQRRRQ